MAKTEEEEGLAAEIKGKIDELREAAAAKIEGEREGQDFGDEEPPEIDKDSLPVRVPDDIVYKLLRLRLAENDCRNRGFILDGFPRNYNDARNVFLIKEKKFDPETGEEIEEEEPELEEGEEKSWEGYIVDNEIVPSSAIVLK